ncbi:MAG: GlsB/YeaQ/YmgE family stress response membrane protein [Deltaproteobacteria bacterium]|nr:GlsB/YeaQ/YmgE family stress response membrane protein [Deltaproteobacteria bacterium]
MEILMWLIIGLVAGVLASMIVGGTGYGIIGDIVVGIVGAFVGGALFRYAGWSAPFGGMAGTIFVAFIGAIVLLLIINLLRGAATRSRRT